MVACNDDMKEYNYYYKQGAPFARPLLHLFCTFHHAAPCV